MPKSRQIRGRYAPSPTGKIHVGNARTALVAWLSVRSQGGLFVWRLEDLDGPRVVQGMAEQAENDLQWLGLDWDEGPDRTGDFGPYKQSKRTEVYENALKFLHSRDFLFPCSYSRKDLETLATAPHGSEGSSPYPKSLRPTTLADDWFNRAGLAGADVNLRFKVPSKIVTFEDRVLGLQRENVAETVGDFVVKRRDGMYAYQLAVVVDDLAMGISEVVRGVDLLASTARQILLVEALGGERPAYAHVPLVFNADGEKLSKRDDGLTLESLRSAGVAPEQLVGMFMHSLGMLDEPRRCSATEAVGMFDWERIPHNDWVLPEDFFEQVLAVRR